MHFEKYGVMCQWLSKFSMHRDLFKHGLLGSAAQVSDSVGTEHDGEFAFLSSRVMMVLQLG